jgi:hypothetical protein
MSSSDMLTKLLSSSNNANNNNNNNDLLKQLFSQLAANNGTNIGNNSGKIQQQQPILPIQEIINNLGTIVEQFFGSKFFIFSIIIIVFGILFLCSFCFMLYCCFHAKWCKKLERNNENKFKLFN